MPYTRSTRNRMLTMTVVMLVIGGVVIAWEWSRGGAESTGAKSAAAVLVDPAALQQVFNDPQLRSLVPLAPPAQPRELGNPAPFAILEEKKP